MFFDKTMRSLQAQTTNCRIYSIIFFIGILGKKITDHCPTFIFFTHLVLSIIMIQKYALIPYSKLNKWKPEKDFE